jgi:hypothetical protein
MRLALGNHLLGEPGLRGNSLSSSLETQLSSLANHTALVRSEKALHFCTKIFEISVPVDSKPPKRFQEIILETSQKKQIVSFS